MFKTWRCQTSDVLISPVITLLNTTLQVGGMALSKLKCWQVLIDDVMPDAWPLRSHWVRLAVAVFCSAAGGASSLIWLCRSEWVKTHCNDHFNRILMHYSYLIPSYRMVNRLSWYYKTSWSMGFFDACKERERMWLDQRDSLGLFKGLYFSHLRRCLMITSIARK